MPWPLHEKPADVMATFTSFQEPGYRLVDAQDLLTLAFLMFSAQHDIRGGTSLINAPQLNARYSQLVGGAIAILPPGLPGRSLTVINDSTNVITIFGIHRNVLTDGQDMIISDLGNTAAVGLAPNHAVEFYCYAPGLWRVVAPAGAIVPPLVTMLDWGDPSVTWGDGHTWGQFV